MLCVGGVHELKLTFFMLKLCTVWSLRSVDISLVRRVSPVSPLSIKVRL